MAKKFRIATEGATTDGRVITADMLSQMAATYDPAKYGARINLEHFRGIFPDGPFKAYGDVTHLTAEEVEVDGQKRIGLFAEIDPTPDLVELARKRQKIYTSMEVDNRFASTNAPYLVGLAITDSPASLGTQMLKFAAGAGEDNPLTARKQKPDNLFSEAVEIDLSGLEAPPTEDKTLFARVKELIAGVSNKTAATEVRLADAQQAITLLADHNMQSLLKLTGIEKQYETLQAAHAKLQADFTALHTQLDQQPTTRTPRPPATGGNAAVVTDC